MARFRRILFNTLTAISLLLAIATAGLWYRSDRVWEYLAWSRPNHEIVLGLGPTFLEFYVEAIDQPRGTSEHLGFTYARADPFYFPLSVRASGRPTREDELSTRRAGGFDWFARWRGNQIRAAVLRVPYWFVLSLACLPTAVWAFSVLRNRLHSKINARRGHCPACGYDMRANPAKCSECGHEAKVLRT